MARSLVAGVYADPLKKFSSSSRRVNQKAFARATSLKDRFFTLLVLPEGSPLIGVEVEKTIAPFPFSHIRADSDEFAG
jgi:hypothetical protein